MTDKQFNLAKDWFEDLRNQLINIVAEIDGNKFVQTNWNHRHEGGGTMSKIKARLLKKVVLMFRLFLVNLIVKCKIKYPVLKKP